MYGGIPQGSALGPLLFLIYINTLPSTVSDGVLLQYADDTTLICCGDNPLTVATSMNQQLSSIQSWLQDNRMQLNIKKSCVIWFHTHCQRNQTYPDIMVDNVGLQVATKQKYLGLMFDSTLSWSDQVSRTCQKSYYLHLINRHRHVLPAYLLKLLMESLVMSHMQYALSVWGPSLTQNQLLRLQRLQNRAVRLVFSLNKGDHISEYYQELHWLRVSQLIQFRLACVMYHQYNAVRGIMFVPPIQFGNCTLYNTRTPSYYANLRRVRLSQTQKQARYQGALVWNKLPSELKEPMSYMTFYDATYTYFINDFCM